VGAGLLLLPFSVGSVVAGRLAPVISDRWSPRVLLPLGAVLLGIADVLFGLERGSLWMICVDMAVAGLGVGTSFSGLPALVVAAVPRRETGSAMSLNQVLRYSGFSLGSATTATVLAATTPSGAADPTSTGYTVIAAIGLATCVVMAVVTWLLPARTTAPAS
jgi:sugar phosphate permease